MKSFLLFSLLVINWLQNLWCLPKSYDDFLRFLESEKGHAYRDAYRETRTIAFEFYTRGRGRWDTWVGRDILRSHLIAYVRILNTQHLGLDAYARALLQLIDDGCFVNAHKERQEALPVPLISLL